MKHELPKVYIAGQCNIPDYLIPTINRINAEYRKAVENSKA